MMKAHFKDQKLPVPTKDYFCKVWCRLYGKKGQQLRTLDGKPKVRLRSDASVGKCRDCQRLRLAIKKSKGDDARRHARQDLQNHLGFVFDQRVVYVQRTCSFISPQPFHSLSSNGTGGFGNHYYTHISAKIEGSMWHTNGKLNPSGTPSIAQLGCSV
jgi:hypothetical protein